jgi:hypothetical protein
MFNLHAHNFLGHALHCHRDVCEQPLPLTLVEKAEQCPWLAVVVRVDAVVPAVRRTIERQWRLCTRRFQRGKFLFSIFAYKSRCALSRSAATTFAASSLVQFAMPCCDLKWNLTKKRSLFALMNEYVCEPKPWIWR